MHGWSLEERNQLLRCCWSLCWRKMWGCYGKSNQDTWMETWRLCHVHQIVLGRSIASFSKVANDSATLPIRSAWAASTWLREWMLLLNVFNWIMLILFWLIDRINRLPWRKLFEDSLISFKLERLSTGEPPNGLLLKLRCLFWSLHS